MKTQENQPKESKPPKPKEERNPLLPSIDIMKWKPAQDLFGYIDKRLRGDHS